MSARLTRERMLDAIEAQDFAKVDTEIDWVIKRGLVQRTTCPEDGRGAFVSATGEGMRAIEQAAPDHVATVRREFLDRLGEDDKRELARLLAKVRGADGAEATRRSAGAGVPSGA